MNDDIDPILQELPVASLQKLISIGVDVVRTKRTILMDAPRLPEIVPLDVPNE